MWKAWAHPLWPGGEVWFRHYMLSQPRIKCANSRCCILGCVRCLFFFPPRLGCFLCSCASRAELFFFFFYSHLPAWPSDSCSVCQLVTLGGSRRGEFDGGKKRKKKEGGVQQWLCKHLGVCRPPQLPLSTARRKRVSLLAVEFLLFGSWWKKVCGK